MEEIKKSELKDAVELVRHITGSRSAGAFRSLEVLSFQQPSQRYLLSASLLDGSGQGSLLSVCALSEAEALDWLRLWDADADEAALQTKRDTALAQASQDSLTPPPASAPSQPPKKARRNRARSGEARRTRHVAMNVTEEEYKTICDQANSLEMTVSQFLLYCVKETLSKWTEM